MLKKSAALFLCLAFLLGLLVVPSSAEVTYSEESLTGEDIPFKLSGFGIGGTAIIKSYAELKSLCEEHDDFFVCTVKYDNEFFKSNDLIFISTLMPDSSYFWVKADSLVRTDDNRLGINLCRFSNGGIGFMVVSTFSMALEVASADVKDCSDIIININDVVLRTEEEINKLFEEIQLKERPFFIENSIYNTSNAIAAGTTVKDFTKNFNYNIKTYDRDGVIITDKNEIMKTGNIVNVYSDTGVIIVFGRIAVKGDVDGDGEVTAADARIALRTSSRLEKLDYASLRAADVNGDGEVLANDARQILRVSSRLDYFDFSEHNVTGGLKKADLLTKYNLEIDAGLFTDLMPPVIPNLSFCVTVKPPVDEKLHDFYISAVIPVAGVRIPLTAGEAYYDIYQNFYNNDYDFLSSVISEYFRYAEITLIIDDEYQIIHIPLKISSAC